jgi:hypothetical protein
MPAPISHMVYAHPNVVGQASMGRFLCYSTSAADAAEAGLEIVRGVVERGGPWPEHELGADRARSIATYMFRVSTATRRAQRRSSRSRR